MAFSSFPWASDTLQIAGSICYVTFMNGNGASLELDAATAHLVDALAKAWGVSKEEAVRRAVTEAQAATIRPDRQGRLQALKELQRRVGLTTEKAMEWEAAIRDGRR